MNRVVLVCECGPRRHVTRDAPSRQEGQPWAAVSAGSGPAGGRGAAPLAGSLLSGQEAEASKGGKQDSPCGQMTRSPLGTQKAGPRPGAEGSRSSCTGNPGDQGKACSRREPVRIRGVAFLGRGGLGSWAHPAHLGTG